VYMSDKDPIITEVRDKKHDWYTIRGVVNGHHVSVDVPGPAVDGKSRKDAEALFKRGLRNVADHERNSSR